MIKLSFQFKKSDATEDVTVELFDVRQARGADHPAPWDVGVTIMWGAECLFNHPLSGADPLEAVRLAAQFAAVYLHGRAEDEGGTLDPEIVPP
jgi:hypothetical protein